MLPRINPENTLSWHKLRDKAETLMGQSILDYFKDKSRVDRYSLSFKDLYLDFSKNLVDDETLDLLHSLADQCELDQAKDAFFQGGRINETEGRSVMHQAVRMPAGQEMIVDGEDSNQKAWRVR